MKVYRYEREDGGGPFCTFDGVFREDPKVPVMKDNYLSGCLSLDDLLKYFENRDFLLKDCHIVIYDVPFKDIKMTLHKRAVLFPKEYSTHFSY